jgi:hypothetical protein
MLPSQEQVVNVGLGTETTCPANLFNPRTGVGSDLMAGSSLIIGVQGGAGADRLAINAQRDVDVAAGARLKMVLMGQDGNDIITGYYRGENDGSVSIREFDGGAGNDIVRGYLKEDLGSTGFSAGQVLAEMETISLRCSCSLSADPGLRRRARQRHRTAHPERRRVNVP